jgi:perosamine synthetase
MIKLIKPYISLESIQPELEEIFNSGQFTQGKNVQRFEADLKNYLSVDYIGLTTSATTALSLSLRVMGVMPGSKVAVSDYSWPASSNVIEELGAIPVFIDINPETFNMSLDDLEKKIDASFSAVIFVDTFGNPSGLEDIFALCQKYKVPLLEDAACALGSEVNDMKVGSIADVTCFSFHPRKLLNTGEGGALATNNQEYAKQFKIKLAAGASDKAEIGLKFTDFGFNYRLTEIQSLMGWHQLKLLDEVISQRLALRDLYAASLIGLGFAPQKISSGVKHNAQSIVFTLPEGRNRNQLVKYLFSKNIESTLGTYCLSGTTFNRQKYKDVQKNSLTLESSAITLPCFEGLDIAPVIQEIENFLKKNI